MSSGILQKAEEIITEISMSLDQSSWLILEGTSDVTFFSTRVLPSCPKLLSAQGWENVVYVIQKVQDEQISSSVFGFVDRDYREDLGVEIDESLIVVTDFRDLEISMFCSKALDRILAEYASLGKVPLHKDGSIDISVIRETVYDIAAQLGKLRFFSLLNQCYCSFPDDIVKNIFDKNKLCLTRKKLVSVLVRTQGKSSVTEDWIETALRSDLPTRLDDERNLCCGHDVFAIFSLLLRHAWGKGQNSAKLVDLDQVSKLFRIGYSDEEFQQTDMGKKLLHLLSQS